MTHIFNETEEAVGWGPTEVSIAFWIEYQLQDGFLASNHPREFAWVNALVNSNRKTPFSAIG